MEKKNVGKKALSNKITLALFSFLGLWFTLSAFGVPAYGDFISWLMVLIGCWVIIVTKHWSAHDIVLACMSGGFFVALIGAVNLLSSFLTMFLAIGNIWHWLIFLYGLVGTLMIFFKVSMSRFYACRYFPQWFFMVTMIIGAWFILHDLVGFPTFGIHVMYVMTFLAPLSFLINQEIQSGLFSHDIDYQAHTPTDNHTKNDDELI